MSIDNKNAAPVGVFDSGVGGLTVAREIMRQLPNENLVYFGDTARVPYGSKSRDNIIRYSRQIIHFLKTKGVKAIVIACNTASALALDVVREESDIPIIGVVEPGARAALQITQTKKIGVIGTEATVQSAMYGKIIKGLDPTVSVIGKACPLFVPLVEEGFASDIDSLILGCTHYPLLRSRIRAYLGDKIQLVNPAYETAMDLKYILKESGMENAGKEGEHATYSFYVSDAADKFKQFANSILPYDIETTQQINIEEY
ncbi:MAG: glutamate racemase [Clostridiales bacterium]|nr:glutamate racemase [Clostridiales bacterium]